MSKKDCIHRLRNKIDNHTHDQDESFGYLGSIISHETKCTTEVKLRIAQSKTTLINKINLLSSKNMSTYVKKWRIKVYLWSVAHMDENHGY